MESFGFYLGEIEMMKRSFVLIFFLLLIPGVSRAESIQDFIKTLDATIEVLGEIPENIERGQEYSIKVRVTNTGKQTLPGLPVTELSSGAPCLYAGWGYSKNPEEQFAFLGTYPITSPIKPGESREVEMKYFSGSADMNYFRLGLWVSQKEEAGYMGGPIGNHFDRRIKIPTTFRDASRKALLVALAVCNAFFLSFLLLDFYLRRKSRHSENVIRPKAD